MGPEVMKLTPSSAGIILWPKEERKQVMTRIEEGIVTIHLFALSTFIPYTSSEG